jgi:hypothetical protein
MNELNEKALGVETRQDSRSFFYSFVICALHTVYANYTQTFASS